MKTFGQEVKTKAELSNDKINDLRISLINEELEELKKAIKDNDIFRGSRCFNRYPLCCLWSRPFFWNKFRRMF